jgi:hypothetical protein
VIAIIIVLALIAAAFVVITQLGDDEADAVLLEPTGAAAWCSAAKTTPQPPRPISSPARS